MADSLVSLLKRLLRDVCLFSEHASGLRLRHYQEGVARAIVDSVAHKRGLSIVVMFPRQSGKNELQAQVEAYLLTLFSQFDAELVKASPTWKPQSLNAMRRLERVLKRNLLTRERWGKEAGYAYRVGSARLYFMSAEPQANVVGHTASLLLEVDEAQDVQPAKFDKDFAPMAASTNATRVYWGTAWTSKTLLARELRAAREAEKRDGQRRVFVLTADDVAAEVPAYGQFVKGQVARLGRNNPLVRTQFYSEEIDAEGGLFPPQRRALLLGAHSRAVAPAPGGIYALLVDVAGEDESGGVGSLGDGELSNPGRDATTCTVIEVDTATLGDPLICKPSYRIVNRAMWVGVKHTALFAQIRALAEHWAALWVVVDATGVGAGLASFLDAALPRRVVPFTFNAATKSQLGWDFLSVVESGRLKDYVDDGSAERREFWHQLEFVQYEALEGQRLRWSVPDGTRDPATGELVHDDLVLSAALVGVLDGLNWGPAGSGESVHVAPVDLLAEIEREQRW